MLKWKYPIWEDVLLHYGLAEYRHSDWLKTDILVPKLSLVAKVKSDLWEKTHGCVFDGKSPYEYGESCIEEIYHTVMTPEEKDTSGDRRGYYIGPMMDKRKDALGVSWFIKGVAEDWETEERYFKKMEQKHFEWSLWSLQDLFWNPSLGCEDEDMIKSLKYKCKSDSKFYSKVLLAIEAFNACDSITNRDYKLQRLQELNAPEVIINVERDKIILSQEKCEYRDNIRSVFRKKGMKQFIIDNFIKPLENRKDAKFSCSQQFMVDQLATSDDIMNSRRVVNGSAFSGKRR